MYFDAITFDGMICPHVTKDFLDGMKYHLIRCYNKHNQVIKEDVKCADLCEDYNSLTRRMSEKVAAAVKKGTFFTDMRGNDMSDVNIPPKQTYAVNPSVFFDHLDDHSEDDIKIKCPDNMHDAADNAHLDVKEPSTSNDEKSQAEEVSDNAKSTQERLADMRESSKSEASMSKKQRKASVKKCKKAEGK